MIADVIEDEWNRLDDDLGILDIDTSAEKISFTSEKNPSPRSLQIIIRTKEIEIDEEEDGIQSSISSSEDIGTYG